MAINSNGQIFAGSRGGSVSRNGSIFHSIDNGKSWTEDPFLFRIDSEFGSSIFSVAINSKNHIFAGTDEGVFKSDDRGESWKPCNNNLVDACGYSKVPLLIINSHDHIIIDKDHSAIFRSFNGGESWHICSDGLLEEDRWPISVDSLATHGDDIFVGIDDRGIMKTDAQDPSRLI